ncbi:MAG: hypothetical protein PHX58_02875 [Desulfovibrio sp.]|jgi:hypothetical protein|nr:hypothetical protein [Desulfovibrio sp.]
MSKKKNLYQLVIVANGKETPLLVSEDRRHLELERQRHVRSLAPGYAEVRELA